MENVIVRLRDLPVGLRGLTILDAEGDYNIYINAKLCDHSRRVAYVHELRHIRRGDFHSDQPIQRLEPYLSPGAPK